MMCVVVCFLASLLLGNPSRGVLTIIGVPDGKATAYAAVQQQTSARRLDRSVHSEDLLPQDVRESGLLEGAVPN